jgi:lipoprotein signal peptidase
LFASVCFLAAGAITFWITRPGSGQDRWLCVALGLICAGTIGNFYDRVVFGGVRDFLHFYAIRWPVFNIADCCLVVGAGILLIQAVFTPNEPKGTTSVTSATVAAPQAVSNTATATNTVPNTIPSAGHNTVGERA